MNFFSYQCLSFTLKEMVPEYNAFISYRHAPRDIAAAEEIQKRLERFPIPKEIQNKYGIRRIERIFRDKSELPLSSNLGDDIEEALLHSQYLIVICSPRTKESLWIQREISLFLEHHDHDHVLTVVCEGDPSEVIPEQLCSRRKTITDPDGTETVIEEKLEPLSCDYRGNFREAAKTELPRLLAVMIGCSYDELMRRRQQYLRKRYLSIGGIVFSALAIFIGYLIYSRAEIQKNWQLAETNLNQSRINQSRYLAESALEALNNQDRLLAIALAERAMPSEGNERPLTAEAMYAISSSLGSYKTSNDMEYTAIRQYETDAEIRKMSVSPDENYLACMDLNNTFYLWRISDGILLKKKRFPGAVLVEPSMENIVLISDEQVSVLSWQTGEELWTMPVSGDTNLDRTLDEKNSLITVTGKHSVSWFSANGAIRGSFEPDESIVQKYNYCNGAKAFPDAGFAAVDFSVFSSHTPDQMAYETILLYDLKKEEYREIPGKFDAVQGLKLLENGSLLIADNRYQHTGQTVLLKLSDINLLNYHEMEYCFSAYDPDRNTLRWTRTLPFSHNAAFHMETCLAEDGKELILVTLSNWFYVLDADNGELLKTAEFPAPATEILLASADTAYVLLNNGQLAALSPETNDAAFRTQAATVSDLWKAALARYEKGHHCILAVDDPGFRIIHYESNYENPAFSRIADIGDETVKRIVSDGRDLFALCTMNSGSIYNQRFRIIDLSTDTVVMDQELSHSTGDSIFLSDGRLCDIALLHKDASLDSVLTLFLMDPKEQTVEEITVFESTFENKESIDTYLLSNDCLFLAKNNFFKELIFEEENPVTKEKRTVSMPCDPDLRVHVEKLFQTGDPDCLLAIYKSGPYGEEVYRAMIINFRDSSIDELDYDFETHDLRPVFNSTRFSLQTADCFQIYDMPSNPVPASYTPSLTIPFDPETVISAAFHEDHFYVLQSDGSIFCYDRNGTFVKRYTGSTYSSNKAEDIRWEFYDQELFLSYNQTLQHFFLSESKRDFCADKALYYDRERNRILIRKQDSARSYSLGTLPVVSPEELVETARQETSNFSLSEEEKNNYGIQ